MFIDSSAWSGNPEGELVDLANLVRGNVRLAILSLAPAISLDVVHPDRHPSIEEDLTTQLAVRQFVGTLKPADQALVIAIFWHGRSAADVARMLNVSPPAISQRLTRVYRLGRAFFGEAKVAA